MIHELTLDEPVRFEPDHVEFVGSVDGVQQAFRVDESVFRKLLQIRHIERGSMSNLFSADPGHFLYVASRKLAEEGPSSAPIRLTLDDLLR